MAGASPARTQQLLGRSVRRRCIQNASASDKGDLIKSLLTMVGWARLRRLAAVVNYCTLTWVEWDNTVLN